MANRCENILVVSGDDATPFIRMMETVEHNTICFDKPFIEEATEMDGRFNFDTAWKPCVDWLIEQSKKYPNTHFDLSFHEGNNFLCGSYEVKNGEVIKKKEFDEINEEAVNFIKDTFGWDNYPL